MTLGFLYWFLVLLSVLFSGYLGFGPNGDRRWGGFGFILFLLLIIIGLALFGHPIKG